jgi:hypothetical protein
VRMLKLFACTPLVRAQIADKREAELRIMWKLKLVEAINNIVRCAWPAVLRVQARAEQRIASRSHSCIFASALLCSRSCRSVSFPVRALFPLVAHAADHSQRRLCSRPWAVRAAVISESARCSTYVRSVRRDTGQDRYDRADVARTDSRSVLVHAVDKQKKTHTKTAWVSLRRVEKFLNEVRS